MGAPGTVARSNNVTGTSGTSLPEGFDRSSEISTKAAPIPLTMFAARAGSVSTNVRSISLVSVTGVATSPDRMNCGGTSRRASRTARSATGRLGASARTSSSAVGRCRPRPSTGRSGGGVPGGDLLGADEEPRAPGTGGWRAWSSGPRWRWPRQARRRRSTSGGGGSRGSRGDSSWEPGGLDGDSGKGPSAPRGSGRITAMQRAVANKVRRAEDILRGTGGVVVAFSAGADSALVAALARRALGARALAVTAVSPSLPLGELEEASYTACSIAWPARSACRPSPRGPTSTTWETSAPGSGRPPSTAWSNRWRRRASRSRMFARRRGLSACPPGTSRPRPVCRRGSSSG